MAFLHGVEVLEIDDGPRPIQTVRTGVIGIVGTAPDSVAVAQAKLNTGVIASNNAITFTAVPIGALGNDISVTLKDPAANNATLSVAVTNRDIVVNLATSAGGAITSTAAQVIAAIAAKAEAAALVTGANNGASTGSGVVAAVAKTLLSGGIDEAFPLNTPVLIAGSRAQAAKLGEAGTLPQAMDDIFDQTGAVIIVIRVAVGVDDAETTANVIGGINSSTGDYEGVHVLLAAESVLGFSPKILCAPGFTHQRTVPDANPVVAELQGIADRLRAIIVADATNGTDADAIAYAGDWGSKRIYVHYPFDKKLDSAGNTITVPASARIAGQIAKSDNDRGFWWSPSNQEVNGIIGTAIPIDFQLGDANCRANLLNEKNVATTIRQDGYRLWGNRTCSSDPKWAFLSVVRIADTINESILREHLWAVDRNITKTYMEDVREGVLAYLRSLKSLGAIIDGDVWLDKDLNTPQAIAAGNVFWDFDFSAATPAERLTFRSHITDRYLSEIF